MQHIPKYWLVIAIIIHAIAAWFSVGHYHDDEYYQILDFVAFKLDFEIANSLMWEFTNKLRGALQPFIAFVTVKAMMIVDVQSPFLWSYSLRLLSALISLVATVIFLKSIKNDIKYEKTFFWVIFFLLFSWILIFMNIRFSSESWGMSFFLIAYATYFNLDESGKYKFIYTGVLLGLAFLARYQVGLMIFGFVCWMLIIKRESLVNLFITFISGCVVVALGVLLDRWLYGSLTFSGWNYFEHHIIGNALDNVLPEEWWFYGYYSAVQLLPPITLVLPLLVIIFCLVFFRHPITWIIIPFILLHQKIDHKEMRYLFPILPFTPVIFAMVMEKIYDSYDFFKSVFFEYFWKFILGLSVVMNCFIVLLVMVLPSSKEVALWQNCLSNKLTNDSHVLLVLDPDGSFTNAGELELDFYNIKDIRIISVADESKIIDYMEHNPEKIVFYSSRKKDRSAELTKANISHSLECISLPEWLTAININNWTSRASLWRVWSIHDF